MSWIEDSHILPLSAALEAGLRARGKVKTWKELADAQPQALWCGISPVFTGEVALGAQSCFRKNYSHLESNILINSKRVIKTHHFLVAFL